MPIVATVATLLSRPTKSPEARSQRLPPPSKKIGTKTVNQNKKVHKKAKNKVGSGLLWRTKPGTVWFGHATLNHQHVVAPRIHILLLPISKDKNNRINCRGTRFLQNSFLFVVKFQKSDTYILHLILINIRFRLINAVICSLIASLIVFLKYYEISSSQKTFLDITKLIAILLLKMKTYTPDIYQILITEIILNNYNLGLVKKKKNKNNNKRY